MSKKRSKKRLTLDDLAQRAPLADPSGSHAPARRTRICYRIGCRRPASGICVYCHRDVCDSLLHSDFSVHGSTICRTCKDDPDTAQTWLRLHQIQHDLRIHQERAEARREARERARDKGEDA